MYKYIYLFIFLFKVISENIYLRPVDGLRKANSLIEMLKLLIMQHADRPLKCLFRGLEPVI